MKNIVKPWIGIATILFLIFLLRPFYILFEGNQAVIVRFGKIVNTNTEAGIYPKVPLVDVVVQYTKKISSWDGKPQRLPTRESDSESQFIMIDTTARWKIIDPAMFYQTVNTISAGQQRLNEYIESAITNVIAQNSITEAVRSTNDIFADPSMAQPEEDSSAVNEEIVAEPIETETSRSELKRIEKGRRVLSDEILVRARSEVSRLGIELMDIVIRQIWYSDELTDTIHERMISERRQYAARARSLGERAREIRFGQLEREKSQLTSEAEREAQRIRGEGDAEAARILSEAHSRNPEFYRFWKSIESYKKALPEMDKILTTDLDYFKYLHEFSP